MRFLTWLLGDDAIVPQPVRHLEWQELKTGISTQYNLVDLKTTKILVRVTHYDDEPSYFIYKNGAGFGEYLSLEMAKKKAEELV